MKEIKFDESNVVYNPNQKLFTPENSPVLRKKVDEATEMLRKAGLPKFKYVTEK
jgi:hypothetical protein